MNLPHSLIEENVSLSQYSSYRIGGTARLIAEPKSPAELKECLDFAQRENLRLVLFGSGANILFPDHPRVDTLYLSLRRLISLEFKSDAIFLSAGISLSLLSFLGVWTEDLRLVFSYLLPGTLGAGIFMNVKYRNVQMSDVVQSVTFLDENCQVRVILASECEFDYKTSVFQKKEWTILGATFEAGKIAKEGKVFLKEMLEEIQEKIADFSELKNFYSFFHKWREKLVSYVDVLPEEFEQIETYRTSMHHFEYSSCGSVFKNNYDFGTPTGALIEQLGMKGLKSGGAQIAPFHGNLILNKGKASAADVLSLIREIQKRVKLEYGFIPEPEVQIVE